MYKIFWLLMQCFADRRWLCLTQLNSAWLILTQIDLIELLYFWIESLASVRQIIVQILLKFLKIIFIKIWKCQYNQMRPWLIGLECRLSRGRDEFETRWMRWLQARWLQRHIHFRSLWNKMMIYLGFWGLDPFFFFFTKFAIFQKEFWNFLI